MTPEIGDHAFVMINVVRYDISSDIKGRQSPKKGDDEIPCPSRTTERDFVGANWWYSHRGETLLNNIIEKKRH